MKSPNKQTSSAGRGCSPACTPVQAVELQGKGPWWTAPSAVSAQRVTLRPTHTCRDMILVSTTEQRASASSLSHVLLFL